MKYAQKVSIFHLKGVKDLQGSKAYTFPDARFDFKGSGVIEGTVDTAKLLERAHAYHTTVTAYSAAVLINAIYKAKITKPDGNPPIVLFVPINLRKPFPSRTLLNFSLFSRVGVDVNDAPSFEEIIKRVETRLKKDTEKEVLQNKINVTAKTERLFCSAYFPCP